AVPPSSPPGCRSGVESLVDRLADHLDAGHAVDPPNDPLRLVIRQDRCGLAAIFGHAGADRFLIVVGAALEFVAAADVAGAGLDRLLVAVVIGRVADRAGEAAGDPVDEGVLIHLQLDYKIELAAAPVEQSVQRLRLAERARIAVEDHALLRREAGKLLVNQLVDDLVGDQLTRVHYRLDP